MEFGVQKVASVISRSLQSYLQLANSTNVALCADQFKLQHPPPGHTAGNLTVHHARGGGNLNVALEGWGI